MIETSSKSTFAETENQAMIRQMVREFGEKYIRPVVMHYDETQEFPFEIFKQLGELGLLGVLVPTEYGGSGFTYIDYVTAIVELAKFCPAIALSMAAHNSLCTGHILQHGSEEQKRKYLPLLATGKWIGAWGLTEPNTGSDAGRMQCVARKEGEYWVINGTKNFITHASVGDVAVVIVRTGEIGDSHGMTAFIVEKGTPGFSAGKKENKLGMRASDTAQLIFDNCRVHESQMIGQEGEGFIQSMKVLDGGRISIAALSLGIAKGALEASIKYAKQREQFGQPIINFQAIQFKLAEMATEVEASELLTYQAAWMKDSGKNVNKESSMAKYYASEVAVKVSTEAVQIFGGYGYTKEYPVEKYYRDSKLCTIGEGTSEIQKLVISRALLKNL
ncbi:MAG: acyl-CoA dehydrogenase family protein [Bacteroidia bacterium]|nr:acyl-CoA dehydrogenase family protein [Bacteroidia bacterium]MDW8347481.1 acyl-CoA dehydrogenase family protein [Bacteroidia bacterium]